MSRTTRNHLLNALTMGLAFLMFFPILWMVLSSFKTEADALALPPKIFVAPYFGNWQEAFLGTDFLQYLGNTLIITVASTLCAIILGVPAAYAMAFYPTKRTDSSMLWVMSTRMLPPAGIIVPLYVLFIFKPFDLGLFQGFFEGYMINGTRLSDFNLLDTHLGMIIIYTGMNVPLVIWMVRSFMLEIPFEIIEAARMDGVTLWQEVRGMVLPLIVPGLAATALLCFIFAWNEFFFAFSLTTIDAAPLSVYISSFKTDEGLFWAKLSAASTATIFPVMIAGWVAQRQLVTGLTMGAVK